jgi:hypothetical protein
MKIGDLRRSLFVGHNCKWNGVVRDVTAIHETTDEEVNEGLVYVGLLETIKASAVLDHQFPRDRRNPSRVEDMFQESV